MSSRLLIGKDKVVPDLLSAAGINTPLSADQDKTGQVYSRIKSVLLAHRVPPGSLLNIRLLADKIRVSPTPIREALIRLADEDIINFVPGRGFFSKALKLPEMIADYEMAFILGRFSIEKNVDRFSIEGLRRPESPPSALNEDENHEIAREYALFIENINERIANLSGNGRVIRIIQQFNDRTSYVRELDLRRMSRLMEISVQIEELLTALGAGDAGSAVSHLEALLNLKLAALHDLVNEGNLQALASTSSVDQLL